MRRIILSTVITSIGIGALAAILSCSDSAPSSPSSDRYTMHEYWPLEVGNAWAWEHSSGGEWWVMTVKEALQVNGYEVYRVQIETNSGTKWDRWLVYVDSLLAYVDSTGVSQLPDVKWDDCREWNGSCSFGLFDELPARGATIDPRWNTEAEWVRGSLRGLLTNNHLYGNDELTLDSLPVDNADNCVGIRTSSTSDSSLYSVLALNVGPVLWDGWPLIYAKVGAKTWGDVPVAESMYGFSINDDTTSQLLYWIEDDWGQYVYFLGYRDSVFTVPNMVVYDDGDGAPDAAIMIRADFIPAMWVMDGVTIGVHNTAPVDTTVDDSTFDPSRAYHIAIVDTARTDFTASISPAGNIDSLLDTLEYVYSAYLTELRETFDEFGIETWKDVQSCAWIEGPRQPIWQARAIALAMGAALHVYKDSLGTGLAKCARAGAVNGIGTSIGLGIITWAAKEYLCTHCAKPGVPTVSMLQCNGIKAIIGFAHICHNSYFWNNGLAGECISKCEVSMGCFTNICMPREVAAEDAEDLLYYNNLHLSAKDIAKALYENGKGFRGLLK